MRAPVASAFVALALLASGCTGVPKGLTPVSGFEAERYLGKWYEVARLDHRFERGLSNVSATYTLRDDGAISVLNRGFDDEDGEWQEANGVARFRGDAGVGSLKVTFFWPFYGGYHIIALDPEDYLYAMVAGPSRSYLWVLSRTRELDPAILDGLLERAAELGFPTDELVFPAQDRPDA